MSSYPSQAAIQQGCVQNDRIAAGLAPFSGNFCTANDLTFVLIGLGIQEDGCIFNADQTTILNLRAIVENTGAATRYDAGLWISTQGDLTRCSLTGEFCTVDADCAGGQNVCVSTARWGACSREILREPVPITNARTCDNLLTPLTEGVNLTCGEGTYINDDGDGCGDVLKFTTNNTGPPDCGQTVDLRLDPTDAACATPDGLEDQTAFDYSTPVVLPCVDRDQDGFVEIPTCTSWGQNETDISCPSKTCSLSGTQCANDADCPGGETCGSPGCSICSGSGASCTSDASCPLGQTCSGTCSVTGSFCSDTIPCSAGQTCQSRTCKGSGDPCATAANCPSGQTCALSTDPICRTELAVPGTSAKCSCVDGLNSNVPVAQMALACSCQQPTTVRPGFPVTCTVSYNNPQPANCIPDPADPERFRCGSFGYGRFDLDDGIAGAGSGSFSPVSASDGGALGGTPDNLTWTPLSSGGNLGVVAAGQAANLTFTYTVSTNAPDGPITLTTTSLFSNKTCAGDRTVLCELDSQCTTVGVAGPCNLDFDTTGVLQPLSTTCSLNVSATHATVSSFDARTEGGRVTVEWQTASEAGTVGFELLRLDPASGRFRNVSPQLFPSLQHIPGGSYRAVDESATPGEALTYELVEVDDRGRRTTHGPFTVHPAASEGTSAEPAGRDEPDGGSHRWAGPLLRGFEANARQPDLRDLQRLASHRKEAAEATSLSSVIARGRQGIAAPRLKIGVRETGLYRLTGGEIASAMGQSQAEVDDLLRHHELRLTTGGVEVPWWFDDSASGLLFYGEAIDSLYTLDNVYWLEVGKTSDPHPERGRRPAPETTLQLFAEHLHLEQDLLGRPNVTNDPQDDYWFWIGLNQGNRRGLSFDVHGLEAGGGAVTLSVLFWGLTDRPVGPDHTAELMLNGQSLGRASWEGTGPHVETLAVAPQLFVEGANQLELISTLGSFFIDSVELGYLRRYEAVGGELTLRGDGHPVVTVTGFATPEIQLYEVTNPLEPQLLETTTVDPDPAGGFRLTFQPATPDRIYLATETTRSPAWVKADRPSTLSNAGNRGSYLVITSAELRGAAEEWVAYRASQGLEGQVVEVEDVMDELNDGVFDPEAIRSFLTLAQGQWALPPRYVLLAGKGSFDYRDISGAGGNLVPPFMAGSDNGLAAADNHYGDRDGDGVPEIAVGRLPVLTSQELRDLLAKVIAYENGETGAWSQRVLLAADNPDSAGSFPADSDRLAALLPAGLTVEKIYLSQPFGLAEARQALLGGLRQGARYLSYVGHGGLDRFAGEGLLTTPDVASLDNGARLPVVTALTCNIALFAFPGFTSLGEELVLHPQGGAAAVWGPTWLSFNAAAVDMGTYLVPTLFSTEEPRLGDALVDALQQHRAGADPGRLVVYNLLGDPALIIP